MRESRGESMSGAVALNIWDTLRPDRLAGRVCKVTKVLKLCIPTSFNSILLVNKEAKKYLLPPDFNFYLPLLSVNVPTDAGIARSVISGRSLIAAVLLGGAWAKVAQSAIKAIAVYMVNLAVWFAEKLAMKIKDASLSIMQFFFMSRPDGVITTTARAKFCIPEPLHGPFVAVSIDNRNLALGERDQPNALIFRLFNPGTWQESHHAILVKMRGD